MMYETMIILSLAIAATGAGLMAGVYFAFSCFIMNAFDELGSARAADAMNSINRVILRSAFMVVFFGSTLLYAALGLIALLDTDLANRGLLILTSGLYITGMFLCTVVFNVPLNNQLAAATGEQIEIDRLWPYYLKHWTRWNHLRGVCSLLTLILSGVFLVTSS
jgi:uncharacterized membrane protein